MDFLYDLWKEAVPGNQRLFLQSLLGDRSQPFTEKDFTSRELGSLRQTVERADRNMPDYLDTELRQFPDSKTSVENRRRRHAQGKGYVSYSDYMTGDGDEAYPAFSRDMLGRFNYERSPQGVRVKDTYDFDNSGREQRVSEYEQMGGLEKLIAALGFGENARVKFPNASTYQTASELGMAFLGRNGRPVDIKLPPPPVYRRGQ